MTLDSPYDVNGIPIWRLRLRPGTNRPYGAYPRIAAYLWYQRAEGDIFTMSELRAEIGESSSAPNSDEHANRRVRELRAQGWVLDSYKDDASLSPNQYRLKTKGAKIWLGEGKKRPTTSARLRRSTFERDGRRCVVCGIGANEPYPEDGRPARLTIGHRKAESRSGESHIDNLQTECARCNEPTRDTHRDPISVGEADAQLRALSPKDRESVLEWLRQGRRGRDERDRVFDLLRTLSEPDRYALIHKFQR